MHEYPIGVVVIGRNEGDRLKRSLQSILLQTDKIIYVDSGSSDDSVDYALSLGLEVVQLDLTLPFSAARARNIGYHHLKQVFGQMQYVQFVDGDCELFDGWLEYASKFLDGNASMAVVAGRLKERFPEHSLYNRLCDMEWDTPVGEILSCGGIFLVRAAAFEQVNGFNLAVVAGEEPELCYRLRHQGWKIYKLEQLMALHDAGMSRFGQWWKRSVRSGYAYAQGCALHGMGCERFRVRECLRIWVWSVGAPIAILVGVFFISPWVLLALAIYPIQVIRVFRRMRHSAVDKQIALMHAMLTVIDKWPQLLGQISFLKEILERKPSTIIEYK